MVANGLQAEKEEAFFTFECACKSHSRIFMDLAWVLRPDLDMSVHPKDVVLCLGQPGSHAHPCSPQGRKDTVVDSPSDHRNEGEVALSNEGVSAEKTNLFSAQVESTPFP